MIVSSMVPTRTIGAAPADEQVGAPRHRVTRTGPNGAKGRGRVTIAQIAAESGLSTATVSKVLNGRPDVSDGTRLLVQKVLVLKQAKRAIDGLRGSRA